MAKMFNTIIARVNNLYSYSSALKALNHMLRIGDPQKFKDSNEKYFNPENTVYNQYFLGAEKNKDNKFIFESIKKNMDKQIKILEDDHNFKMLGHHSIALKKLKNQIYGLNYALFSQNKEQRNELYELEDHLSLKKFLKINKDIKFNFKDKQSESKYISWEDFMLGKTKYYNKDIGKTILKEKAHKPSFITNIQIHASREWFEQMRWIDYNKKAIINIDPITGNLIPAMENIGVKSIKDYDAIGEWTQKNIEVVRNKMIEKTGSANNLLAASLHMDESKPHIDIMISNIWERSYYYEKTNDGVSRISKKDALERINDGDDSIIESRKLNIITDFKDEELGFLLNSERLSLDTILPLHLENFDSNMKGYGYAKEFYNINRYQTMDQYKISSNNMFNFKVDNSKSIEDMVTSIDNIESKNEYIQSENKKATKAFKAIIQEIYKELTNNPSSDLSKFKKRLILESGISDDKYIDKLLDQLKKHSNFWIQENKKNNFRGR